VAGSLSDWTFVGVLSSAGPADSQRVMIIGLVYLAILASVPLAGGRLTALADLPLRKPGLAGAAIALQVLIISVIPGGHQAFHTTVHMLSYVLLGAFAF